MFRHLTLKLLKCLTFAVSDDDDEVEFLGMNYPPNVAVNSSPNAETDTQESSDEGKAHTCALLNSSGSF